MKKATGVSVALFQTYLQEKAMQGYHFFTTGRVSPVLCRSEEKGWESI